MRQEHAVMSDAIATRIEETQRQHVEEQVIASLDELVKRHGLDTCCICDNACLPRLSSRLEKMTQGCACKASICTPCVTKCLKTNANNNIVFQCPLCRHLIEYVTCRTSGSTSSIVDATDVDVPVTLHSTPVDDSVVDDDIDYSPTSPSHTPMSPIYTPTSPQYTFDSFVLPGRENTPYQTPRRRRLQY